MNMDVLSVRLTTMINCSTRCYDRRFPYQWEITCIERKVLTLNIMSVLYVVTCVLTLDPGFQFAKKILRLVKILRFA